MYSLNPTERPQFPDKKRVHMQEKSDEMITLAISGEFSKNWMENISLSAVFKAIYIKQ